MPRAGRNGRRKGRGKRGLASCSLRPKGRDLDVVAALSTRRKERRIAWFLEEGKSKGGKEGKRKTKRGKERRGREGRSVVGTKDSYSETQDRESKERSGERKRRRGGKGKEERISIFLPTLQAFEEEGREGEEGPVGSARFLPGSIMDMFPPAQS